MQEDTLNKPLTEAKNYGRITALNPLISLEKTGYTTYSPNDPLIVDGQKYESQLP
jgi:hypothetical protein